jgi:hypothetical protein
MTYKELLLKHSEKLNEDREGVFSKHTHTNPVDELIFRLRMCNSDNHWFIGFNEAEETKERDLVIKETINFLTDLKEVK